MDKELRNTLKNIVTKCRKLLEEAIGELLQGRFGIHGDGTVEDTSRLMHLSVEELRYREELLAHLEHMQASGLKRKAAAAQLIREAAFTHLNRLCAYKMMAARKLIEDPVGKGLKSRGFMFYLAEHPDDEALYRNANEDIAYRRYLDWLNEDLSDDIGVLFASEDLATRLFPTNRVLMKLLDLINTEELSSVWNKDEAIGWVYQYFTPKELRELSRKEHLAPQNSYELAFRNQFYTPRYVVEFLVDNTLGRLWYEMRKGETELNKQCEYLVRRPTEVFLPAGEEPPGYEQQKINELSQEDLLKQPFHIRHRNKKDPRQIKVLDPACGSGHFLLYCFDVLQTIYLEAYADEELGPALKRQYANIDQFKRDVPRLILENNLHGIDIDLRSTQISGLALWLRAQRAYENYGIEKSTRPQVRKTNIVCAEPMPGERELLEEFLKEIYPPFLSDAVRVVFDKMKLAGEAGSLLKIEEQITDAIAEAKKQWRAIPEQQQLTLFRKEKLSDGKQGALFDLSGITDEDFWNEAEARVLESLQEYSQRAVGSSQSIQRRLFAEDAAHGFAFVDICRNCFDVVLMNPPFGEPSAASRSLIRDEYGKKGLNLLVAFALRAREMAPQGIVGAITDSTWLKKTDYKDFRKHLMDKNVLPEILCELGWGVLDDANVSTCMFIATSGTPESIVTAIRLVDLEHSNKETQLPSIVGDLNSGHFASIKAKTTFIRPVKFFNSFPEFALAYETADVFVAAFQTWSRLDPSYALGRRGYTPGDTFRFFRCWWEVSERDRHDKWWTLNNGSSYAPVIGQGFFVSLHEPGWEAYKTNAGFRLESERWFGLPGLGYGKRTDHMYAYTLPARAMFSHEGPAFFPVNDYYWSVLAYLNSSVCQSLINLYCGQHKTAGYVSKVPTPDLSSHLMKEAGETAKSIWREVQALFARDETSEKFIALLHTDLGERVSDVAKKIIAVDDHYRKKLAELDKYVLEVLSPLAKEPTDLNYIGHNRPSPTIKQGVALASSVKNQTLHPRELLQYCIGISLGRWDIRYATGELQRPELINPLEPLPSCPPATVKTVEGALACQTPPNYPVRVNWDGILVDDATNDADVVAGIRMTLRALLGDGAEDYEREVCRILKVSELRHYFRQPGNAGFWVDHIDRYTRSRRKAPIYWLLQSTSRNYAIWLYYHRLDKDILFKALLKYVEPKLRLEENNLAQLKQRHGAVGTTGREGKQLERDLDKQESFLSELYDFRDRLKRAADLNLEPDLNDGVVLNIASLWELVPWKEAEKYWKELLEGKYEWSSIAKQLRQRGFVQA